MSIANYLVNLAGGLNSDGVIGASKGGTGLTSPGLAGKALVSDGTLWTSQTVASGSPKVSAIGYTGDNTAANPAGGETITLTGTGFLAGARILINTTQVSVVTVVSETQITFTAPVLATGSYILYVVNTDGATAILVPGIQYSGVPAWSTSAGSLGSVNASTSASFSVSASSDSTVTYSVYSGSLPSGLSLNSSTGAITGTAPAVGSSTTYNFTIRATDSQNQDTDRNFSITIASVISISLVIAGGGGGSSAWSSGGGGGGGGVIQTTTTISPGTAYTITVGLGSTASGAGAPSTLNGGNSSFIGTGVSLTAIGGGGGGGGANGITVPGGSGGSGGGGGYQAAQGSGAGGAGTAGQGNSGGSANSGLGGGGGGGAGGAGNYYGASYGGGFNHGTGGDGVLTFLGSGDRIGTGGSSSSQGSTSGTYGHGGTVNGSIATAGVVAIRYADTNAAASATTGTPTVTVAGGYRVYKFTSSGSITF